VTCARAILAQALATIGASPSATQRVVLVPWLVSIVAYYGVDVSAYGSLSGPSYFDGAAVDTLFETGPAAGWYWLSAFVSIGAWLWLAVGWHRYVLAGEAPSGSYLGKLILTFLPALPPLICVVVAITVATPDEVYWAPSAGAVISDTVMAFAIMFVAMYFGLRLGPILPAAALDQPMKLVDAWRKTAPYRWTILRLSAILAALTLPFSVALSVAADNDMIYFMANAIYDLGSFLGIAVLTVFYSLLLAK